MNKKLITIAIQTAIMGGALSLAPQVYAADDTEIAKPKLEATADEQGKEPEIQEKITVTGSRLRRDSFSITTPLAVLGRDDIEDTGLGSLAEILVEELPQISEGSSNSNSQSSVQNTGLSTIDLRELGTNRTLTLIDGRRVVSNSYSGNYVSLSTIPSGMVERVEVITGGASAAYGSDAIAGVVNIITQQDKEGFSFKARGGESTEGGAKEFTLDLDYGTEFADDRGYLFFSSTYDKQYGLSYWDRDRAQQQESWRYNTAEMCNAMYSEDNTSSKGTCMRDMTQADWRNLSDSIAGGVFDEKSSYKPDSGFWYDENGLRDDWHEEKYGRDFNQFVMLKVPDEAISAAIKVDFELTDDIQSYFQVQYSENRSINQKSPESEDEFDGIVVIDPVTGESSQIGAGRIPKNNPYMPQEIYDQASSKGVKWDRGFDEVGNIINDNTRKTIRSWAGLQGTIFDGNWDWDLSVGYGKFTQEQTRYNELYIANLTHALNAEKLDDGTIQCADADARAAGCVPINLFGEGSITPEAADYIRATPTISTDVQQTTVLGYIAGDLFEMPAGPVASAFGFEYRKDEQSVDTNVPLGGVSFNYVPTFSGDVSVYEVFGEAAFPLLKDVAGAKSLTAEVSARLADYSWSGTGLIQSYKTGVTWQPVEGYAIRANWARAQRAPSITELLSPPRGDYDSFDDICEGTTLTSTDAGHDNCRLEPGIAAVIADGSEFEDDNNGYSPNVGNSELKEETADTYTLGITLAPEFAEGLRIAVDYYDITISDAISSFSNEDIIDYCYNSSLDFGDDNNFCNDIQRDAEGQITTVNQRVYNVDEIKTNGFDFAAEYRYELDKYGSLKFKADWTHVIGYEQTVQSPEGPATTNYEGDLSQDIFEDKVTASLSWYYDDAWRVRWSTRFKSAVVASRSVYDDWEKAITKNNEYCADGSDKCVLEPEALDDSFYNLPSYITHNLSVSYTLDLANDGELRFFGGVNNIFDDRGPFMAIGGRGNFDSNYGGGKGRFAYAGAEFKF
ncbi:TonB-dependent receptor domain-containing protein [Shewanella woodyi]|uniref:TonB-dependent receptor n=1 Tax=Shewanella woodyi (strain ATCC 51908 / MS32) TaxID=392500 RepID=B1KEG6_SHEWM|nr:TonB-dependent receptor [Shewanella woodyi]ACA86544.1 TonB-dependent receptor [Shewanella woodyi ATCC 51908]